MKRFSKIDPLKEYLASKNGQSIGFVPTMGALHKGHISLIEEARKKSDLVVVSIFVNPKQFNKQGDFDNYPKTLQRDTQMLEESGCQLLFVPTVDEMYPPENNVDKEFDFGLIASLMEGEHRPGHFNGVGQVIDRFFEIILPDYAFFGEKDFQQLAVVRSLVKQTGSKVEIVGCPTIREKSGLAMSSRNERLTTEEKAAAAAIFKALDYVSKSKKAHSISELKNYFVEQIRRTPFLELEYFEIADENSLQPADHWEGGVQYRAFTAVNIRDVRLIDNITIIN